MQRLYPRQLWGNLLVPSTPLTALQHVDWLVGCYGTAEWMLSLLPLACCLWGASGAPLGLGLVPATVMPGALGQFACVAALKPSGYFSADTPWSGPLGACSPSRGPFCQGHPEEGALGLAGLGWAVPSAPPSLHVPGGQCHPHCCPALWKLALL